MLLGHRGYATLHATTLRGAREILSTEPVDLVILDIRLGVDHGLDLLYSLPFEGPNVPVIVCTSDTFARARYRGAVAASAGWFVKPFDFDELTGAIQQLLGPRDG